MKAFKKLLITTLSLITLNISTAYSKEPALLVDYTPFIAQAKADALDDIISSIDTSTKDRIIYLSGPIDANTGNEISKQILALEKTKPGEPITIKINSEGGSVYAGLQIYDAMNSVTAPIRTECVGICMSMAGYLLSAGEPGYRTATPNATILLHTLSGGTEGHLADMKNQVNEADRLQNSLYNMLQKGTHLSKAKMVEICSFNDYIPVEEAKKYNIIDTIEQPAEKKHNELRKVPNYPTLSR